MPTTYRKVGAKIVLDGEQEYKQAVAEINSAQSQLRAEMKKLQAEYKGNTESAEYLTKANEILEQQLAEQAQKTEEIRKMQAQAQKAYAEAQEQVNKTVNASTEEQEKAQKELAATKQQLDKYTRALTDSETQEINLKNSIEENTQAMEGQKEEMSGLGDTVEQLADKLGIRIPSGAKNALNGMRGFSTATAAAMAAAAAAIAAVVNVVKELGQLTIDVAAQVDAYITESAITGVPTDILQAWDYAAPLIDVDAETIKGAMTKLTNAMDDARDGSGKSAEAFEALGISVTNADGSLRSAQDVFYEAIDALGNVGNQTERDALAMDLMGKSAQDLNPLISQGSDALREYADEAEALGYVLDSEQIQKLGEVDDAYQKLQLTIEANKKQLAAEFAPAAKEAMELFTDVVDKAGQALRDSGIKEGVKAIFEVLKSMLEPIAKLLDDAVNTPGILKPVKDVLFEIAYVLAQIKDVVEFLKGLFNTGSIFHMKEGLEQMKNAIGLGYSSGNPSATQKVDMMYNGTYSQYQDFYNERNGASLGSATISTTSPDDDILRRNPDNWIPQPHNASGSENWRGGLTWVGEAGPELVSLPRGSQIYTAQESRNMTTSGGTENYYFSINVDDLEDLQGLITWAKTARVRARMR